MLNRAKLHRATRNCATRNRTAARRARSLLLAPMWLVPMLLAPVFGVPSAGAQSLNALLGAGQAPVGPLRAYQAASRLVVAGADPNAIQYQTPKGAGYDGVGALFIERTDGNFLCSGTLLAGGAYMLTAAHCLTDAQGQMITQRATAVFFPPGAPASSQEIIGGTAVVVHPNYTGEVIDAHDVAVVRLGASPSFSILSNAYDLFTGNPFGQTGELVGSGASGTGSTGATVGGSFALGDRRRGSNGIDFSWTNPVFGGFFLPSNGFFGTADPFGLVADFDNGTGVNDASCNMGRAFGTVAFCNAGLGDEEVSLGSGDSGGPLFINGQIAGIASYSLTFGTSLGDTDNQLNGTFGEFSGWASVGYNQQFIAQFVTPEPASFALVAVGVVLIVAGAHRRTRSA